MEKHKCSYNCDYYSYNRNTKQHTCCYHMYANDFKPFILDDKKDNMRTDICNAHMPHMRKLIAGAIATQFVNGAIIVNK